MQENTDQKKLRIWTLHAVIHLTPKAIFWKCSLEVLQNLHENTFPIVSLKKLWHRCFHVSFAKCLTTTFLQNTSG